MHRICHLILFAACIAPALAEPARDPESALREGAFENAPLEYWLVSHGGDNGGGSSADIIAAGGAARSGKMVAQLEAETGTNSRSSAWASISQQINCAPRAQMNIEAWLRVPRPSSATNALVRLRLEYFEDEKCEVPICRHMRMAGDLALADIPAGSWKKIALADTVPQEGRAARISIILCVSGGAGARQILWVDDVALTVIPPPVRQKH